ncbi:MAG: hypothetical protein B6I20_13350 [Bacteroidetes bacterium 4572_117]|nr:MAG: hypothetical protein B6I20_13350 [Bacteroidetes bacterium 4572_117]
MIKHISVFVVIQMFFFLQANSQFKSRISLEIIDINYNKGNVVVRYNINNSRQKDNIRVWINVFSSENDTIRAKSWRGDVNKFVNGEGEKTAIWDVGADGIGILDSIYVKVSASVQNGFYLDSPFILSTVFPGLGDYKINPKKPYWIYGALAYSFIGSSIYLNNYSYNTFINKYKPTETVQDKDTYFDLSKKTKTISYALIGAAGAIWAIDYYRLLKRTKQIKKAWEKSYPVRETPT